MRVGHGFKKLLWIVFFAETLPLYSQVFQRPPPATYLQWYHVKCAKAVKRQSVSLSTSHLLGAIQRKGAVPYSGSVVLNTVKIKLLLKV